MILSSIFFAVGDFERVDRAIQQGEGGAGEEQQGGEGGGLLLSPFILAHHQLPQQSDHQSHHQHLLQHQSHDKPRCGDKVLRRTAGGSVVTKRGGTVVIITITILSINIIIIRRVNVDEERSGHHHHSIHHITSSPSFTQRHHPHHYCLPQHHLDHSNAHQEDPCGRGEVFNKRQNLVEEQSQRKEEELWRTQSRGERRCICICETSSKKTYLYLLDIIRDNVFLFV